MRQLCEDEMSLLAVDQYFRELREVVPLSKDEEARLVACVVRGKQEQGRPVPDGRVLAQAREARDRLVVDYWPLVLKIARQYERMARSMTLLDLVQEGSLGVMEALERYDPASGYVLCQYVVMEVRSAITGALWRRDRLIRLSESMRTKVSKLRRVAQQVCGHEGHEPTLAEMARLSGLSQREIEGCLDAQARREVVSLQGMVETDADFEDFVTLHSLYGNESSVDEQQEGRRVEAAQAVQEALLVLEPLEREVVCLRFGLVDGAGECLTYKQVAARMGTTIWKVQGVELRARRKLEAVLGLRYGVVIETRRLSCEWCAQEFTVMYSWQRFCSETCRVKAQAQRQNERRRARARERCQEVA